MKAPDIKIGVACKDKVLNSPLPGHVLKRSRYTFFSFVCEIFKKKLFVSAGLHGTKLFGITKIEGSPKSTNLRSCRENSTEKALTTDDTVRGKPLRACVDILIANLNKQTFYVPDVEPRA